MLQFTDTASLMTHYAQLKSKFQGPRVVAKVYIKVELPVEEPPPPKKVLTDIPQHLLDQYHNPFVNSSKSRITAILRDTAEKHGLTEMELMTKNRKSKFVVARQEAIYRIRHEVKKSMTEIARIFDKDHTTILHALEKHSERIKADGQ